MKFDLCLTDEQIRLKCLELALHGREGWSDDNIIPIANNYFKYIKEGVKNKEKEEFPHRAYKKA